MAVLQVSHMIEFVMSLSLYTSASCVKSRMITLALHSSLWTGLYIPAPKTELPSRGEGIARFTRESNIGMDTHKEEAR